MHATTIRRGAAARLHRLASDEQGLIREAVFFLALLALFTLILLDVLAIYSTQRSLSEDSRNAAKAAVAVFVTSADDSSARVAAVEYLQKRGARLVAFSADHGGGVTVYTVTAARDVKTFLVKYMAHLPKVGDWIEGKLRPQATEHNL